MNEKQNNFVRISENRLDRILTIIKQLGNLRNTSFYQYTNAEINALFDKIDKESKRVRKALCDVNDKNKGFEL